MFKKLVEEKSIDAQAFNQAILELQKSSTSKLEVMIEYCNIEPQKMALVIAAMIDEQKGLNEIQQQYQILSPDEWGRVEKTFKRGNKGVWQTLLEKKIVTEEQVSIDSGEKSSEESDKKENSSDEAVISDAALASLKELVDNGSFDAAEFEKLSQGKADNTDTSASTSDEGSKSGEDVLKTHIEASAIEESFVESFMDLIEGDQRSQLKNLVTKIRESLSQPEPVIESLDSIHHSFYMMKGSARLMGAKVLESLLEKITTTIDQIKESWPALQEEDKLNKSNYLEQAIEHTFALIELIIEYKDEKKISEKQDLYNHLNMIMIGETK